MKHHIFTTQTSINTDRNCAISERPKQLDVSKWTKITWNFDDLSHGRRILENQECVVNFVESLCSGLLISDVNLGGCRVCVEWVFPWSDGFATWRGTREFDDANNSPYRYGGTFLKQSFTGKRLFRRKQQLETWQSVQVRATIVPGADRSRIDIAKTIE